MTLSKALIFIMYCIPLLCFADDSNDNDVKTLINQISDRYENLKSYRDSGVIDAKFISSQKPYESTNFTTYYKKDRGFKIILDNCAYRYPFTGPCTKTQGAIWGTDKISFRYLLGHLDQTSAHALGSDLAKP